MSFFGRWKSEAGKTECEINKKLHTGYRGSALQAQSPKIPFFEGSSVHRRKRAFLSVSRGPRAVMTAEAALVLPLFLFAFVTLLIPMRILDTERQVLAAAEAAAEEISRSGYFLLENPDGRETLSEAAAFVYAEAAIRTRLKDADLDGLSLAGSRLLSDGETVDLKVTYRHRFPFPVLRMQSVQRTVRCVRRAWIGMEDGAAEGSGTPLQEPDRMVYVGKDGTRYHESRTCHYLYNDLTAVPLAQIGQHRSADGSRYVPCSRCGSEAGSMVYILPSGSRYHSGPGCTAIQAYARAVPKSQVQHLGACSYCGQGG